MYVLPRVAVEAPGVNLSHIRPHLQALVQLHRAVQAAPCAVAHAVHVALGVALQAGALRDEGLLHQTAAKEMPVSSSSGWATLQGILSALAPVSGNEEQRVHMLWRQIRASNVSTMLAIVFV